VNAVNFQLCIKNDSYACLFMVFSMVENANQQILFSVVNENKPNRAENVFHFLKLENVFRNITYLMD
jgi:hypothetical protein